MNKYKKKNTECNEINSVNSLYLRITDTKGKFKKGKVENDDIDVLRKIVNIWKRIKAKIEENTDSIDKYYMIKYDKVYSMIKIT